MADEQPSRFLAHLMSFTLWPLAIDCLTKEPVTGESINTPKEMNYHDRVFSICSLIYMLGFLYLDNPCENIGLISSCQISGQTPTSIPNENLDF